MEVQVRRTIFRRDPELHNALSVDSVVDASDASHVAADVVEHSLDDVRLHAKLGHASSDSAPYIM